MDCPPPSSEFIRVRDDDDYWIECMTLDYEPEKGRQETYFIATELMNSLPPEVQSEVKWSRLYTVMARRGYVTFTVADQDLRQRAGPALDAYRTGLRREAPSGCGRASPGRTGSVMCRSTPKAISVSRNGPSTLSRSCWISRSGTPTSIRWTIP